MYLFMPRPYEFYTWAAANENGKRMDCPQTSAYLFPSAAANHYALCFTFYATFFDFSPLPGVKFARYQKGNSAPDRAMEIMVNDPQEPGSRRKIIATAGPINQII
jgi:hypothetical protein